MNRDISKKTYALIYIRAIVVTILLGSFYLFKIEYYKLSHPAVFSYFIISQYFITILYAIITKNVKTDKQYNIFLYTQITIDVVSETFLIYLTGGIGSMFSFLFPLSIVSAGILLDRRACYIIATASSLLYGTLLDLQFYGLLGPYEVGDFTEKDFFYKIFAHITAFYLIAFLIGYLSERLRRVTQSLVERDTVLNDLKAFSRYIIESMPSGVFTTDLNGKILSFNTSAEEITNLKHSDVVGKMATTIFPFLPKAKEPIERLDGEMESEGKTLSVGMRLSKLRDGSGNSIGMIGVFQDLTELKAMEAEVKKKEKWAVIGELSASIAHELRNPLASLRASVDMLRGKALSEEHAEKLMKIALSEMDRLNGIITDFLVYAKPGDLNSENFDLHESLRDIVMLLKNSSHIRDNINISTGLEGPLLIHGDPKQLRQVFWNLSINAVDAVSDGGTVDIFTEKNGDFIDIVFKDTGPGISSEAMDKIFYPFFTTKEKGTGLGLSIALKIVEEHGGRILARPNGAEAGTTFKIILPADNI